MSEGYTYKIVISTCSVDGFGSDLDPEEECSREFENEDELRLSLERLSRFLQTMPPKTGPWGSGDNDVD